MPDQVYVARLWINDKMNDRPQQLTIKAVRIEKKTSKYLNLDCQWKKKVKLCDIGVMKKEPKFFELVALDAESESEVKTKLLNCLWTQYQYEQHILTDKVEDLSSFIKELRL